MNPKKLTKALASFSIAALISTSIIINSAEADGKCSKLHVKSDDRASSGCDINDIRGIGSAKESKSVIFKEERKISPCSKLHIKSDDRAPSGCDINDIRGVEKEIKRSWWNPLGWL